MPCQGLAEAGFDLGRLREPMLDGDPATGCENRGQQGRSGLGFETAFTKEPRELEIPRGFLAMAGDGRLLFVGQRLQFRFPPSAARCAGAAGMSLLTSAATSAWIRLA